jgi:putative oxidoreductase
MKTTATAVVAVLLRGVLGMVFLVAAAGKLANPEEFARTIANYQLLPVALVNLPAIVLPWLELVVGMLLIAGVRLRAAATVAALLLGIFTLALISALVRGLDIHCGCFSQTAAERIGWGRVLEDVLLLAAALLLAWWAPQQWTLEQYLQQQRQ